MNYELYHDESQEGGFWHGMLLIPTAKKDLVVSYLRRAREGTSYSEPLSIKKVKEENRIFTCAEAWLQIGVASLVSDHKGVPYEIFLGDRVRGKKRYAFFDRTIGAKFILFRELDTLSEMTGHIDHGSKVETTARMGLKGGLHLLGSEDEPIHVTKLHFDGHEHLQRYIDADRVVGRLGALRGYCSVADDIDDRPSNHKGERSQPYDDCQLLQLTDLFVGSFRTAYGEVTREIHRKLAWPVKLIAEKYNKGPARMRNSRWHRGFCLSQCYLENGKWHFETIEFDDDDRADQLGLF